MFSHFPRVLRALPAILAGSLLAASAQAAVIYNPVPTVDPTDNVVLELPDGGKLEIRFGPDGKSGWWSVKVSSNSVVVLDQAALGESAQIGAESGLFVGDFNLYRIGVDGDKKDGRIQGPWAANPAGYLGFSFTDAKEEVRYGWVDLEITPDGLSVHGWAYENEAGRPILAGAGKSVGESGGGVPAEAGGGEPVSVNPVPEPGVLALFGIGALGLIAARKRARR